MEASSNGHKEVVELLISKGADVNARDGGRNVSTPLSYATRKGHKEVVELLITKGANVNAIDIVDFKRSAPLDYA